jgi:hypothetical protein
MLIGKKYVITSPLKCASFREEKIANNVCDGLFFNYSALTLWLASR